MNGMKRMIQFSVWPALVACVVIGCRGGDAPTSTDAERRQAIDAMYAEYQTEFPNVPALRPADIMGHEDDYVLVDVRTAEEQAVSMIPGAITQAGYESRRDEFGDTPVVTYCTIGYRSGLYAKKLRDAGVDAANLEGSVLNWAHAGGDFVHEGQPTKRVHVYGPQWNLLPDGYEGTW